MRNLARTTNIACQNKTAIKTHRGPTLRHMLENANCVSETMCKHQNLLIQIKGRNWYFQISICHKAIIPCLSLLDKPLIKHAEYLKLKGGELRFIILINTEKQEQKPRFEWGLNLSMSHLPSANLHVLFILLFLFFKRSSFHASLSYHYHTTGKTTQFFSKYSINIVKLNQNGSLFLLHLNFV